MMIKRLFILPLLSCFIFVESNLAIAESGNVFNDEDYSYGRSYSDLDGLKGEGEDEPFDLKQDDDEEQVKKLGVRDFMRDSFFSYAGIWAIRFFYVKKKNDRIFDTSFSDWIDNITKAPEVDDGDSFITNYVTHPLIGSAYYLYYRAMGWGFWGSALGSAVQSTLFEYTVEGTVETPSLPDLLATPGVGVPLGFLLETISDWLITRDSSVAKFAAHIFNPMRNFVHDRKFVLLNPLTGHFEFSGPFFMIASKKEAIRLSYPYFQEPPIPLGRFMGLIEAVSLKKDLGGGEFIFYHIRADFPSSDGFWGGYLRITQGGEDNVTVDGDEIDDGFEFANILVGGKFLLYKTHHSVFSGGLDLILPTAYKDNVNRLQTLSLFKRDFPIYLFRAFTFSPYLSAAAWKKWFSVQANLGVDFITNAGDFEGDAFEFRIKYGAAAGVNFPIRTSPTLFVEFDGYTLTTANSMKKTDTFITSGMRFGKKFSPGVGVQIPLSGSTKDIANLSFIADVQLRF